MEQLAQARSYRVSHSELAGTASPVVIALTESIMRESTARSADLAMLKARLIDLATFLCTPAGRTHKNCAMVTDMLDDPDAWRRVNRNRARSQYLPDAYQDLLDALAFVQFTIAEPGEAEAFDATPEQLLIAARELHAEPQ